MLVSGKDSAAPFTCPQSWCCAGLSQIVEPSCPRPPSYTEESKECWISDPFVFLFAFELTYCRSGVPFRFGWRNACLPTVACYECSTIKSQSSPMQSRYLWHKASQNCQLKSQASGSGQERKRVMSLSFDFGFHIPTLSGREVDCFLVSLSLGPCVSFWWLFVH